MQEYVKKSRAQSKLYTGRIFEKNIKELNPREACRYLGVEGRNNVEQKIEKEKLRKKS